MTVYLLCNILLILVFIFDILCLCGILTVVPNITEKFMNKYIYCILLIPSKTLLIISIIIWIFFVISQIMLLNLFEKYRIGICVNLSKSAIEYIKINILDIYIKDKYSIENNILILKKIDKVDFKIIMKNMSLYLKIIYRAKIKGVFLFIIFRVVLLILCLLGNYKVNFIN